MPKGHCSRLAVALAGLLIVTPSAAQYDRDGRYVPSPMGVPQDPYARPIPGYSGAPGEPKGTPIWPRGAIPQPPELAPMKPGPGERIYPRRDGPPRRVVDCRHPWSKSMGIPRETHEKLCRKQPDLQVD